MSRLSSSHVLVLGCMLSLGCGASKMPDPRDAAREYARAAREGDAGALYGMLTSEAQEAYGPDGAERLVRDARSELVARGDLLNTAPLEVEARAELGYADGEVAVLDLEDGGFRVGSAGTLPAGAATPSQALAELRWALSRRSYAGLSRVLAQKSRLSLEDQLTSLVRSLERPEVGDLFVQGDQATVILPEGHQVTLRREGGVWKVEEFR